MITLENHIGKITISNRYLTDLIRNTVAECFGVADMNAVSFIDDVCSFFRKDKSAGNGVIVRVKDNRLIINLHISVIYGTNIPAVVSSIKHELMYTVKEATGIDVARINISVDNITE
ncbi:MAG: Asp23/Gls24 family envelope stress response protein [Ruminococcus sp.]|nr:Asp23/Gls24 family envelope stress response protein [Ruminococcus sp.]